MSQSYAHHADYVPPIPAIEISLQSPEGDQSVGPLLAVLDTGADITMVPLRLLENLNAPQLDEVRLHSHWGRATTVKTYLVSIQFGFEVLPGVEVVGDEYGSQEVLVGRDVLNKLLLLIDGPQHLTDILARRPRDLVRLGSA